MSSTDTTEQRAREAMMSAFELLSKTEASLPGIVTDALLTALADAGIRLAGEGEVVVNADIGAWLRDAVDAAKREPYNDNIGAILYHLRSALNWFPTTQPGTSDDAQEGQC